MCCGQEGSSRENSGYTPLPLRLFHVRGTNDFNTQAIEVSARCSNLNSNDVFVLSTENCCFLWYGKVSGLSCNMRFTVENTVLVDTMYRSYGWESCHFS